MISGRRKPPSILEVNLDLELITKDIEDKFTRENFFRLGRFIDQQQILEGDWQFFAVDISGAFDKFPVAHNLDFVPKDIIILSISGDQNLYFRYQEFDSSNIYVTTSGPCVVRFYAGVFFDKSYGNINKSYPLVAPIHGSASAGSIKAGIVSAGSFSGNPKKYTVVFSSAFPSTDYTISLCGVDSRNFSYENKSISGFVINTGANTALSDEVSWEAVAVGESSSSRSIKAGIIDPSDFSGTPKKCSIAFTTPFATTDYVISIAGVDSRDFSYESKLTTGFTINTNANTALAEEVSWNATVVGES